MSIRPKHIAIIMDGNGRWARMRGLPRAEGHKAGMEALSRIVHYAVNIGLPWLTLFAFSKENWARPEQEVTHLLGLLKFFVETNLSDLCEKDICIKIIGDQSKLPEEVRELLQRIQSLTVQNTGLNLVVAFNYSGQDEILRAAQKIVNEAQQGLLKASDLTPEFFSSYLDTKGFPDPDLIIRTSGEMRLSNFLLWQSAYAELYFCSSYWPDFSPKDLDAAIEEYSCRDRRFGALQLQEKNDKKEGSI